MLSEGLQWQGPVVWWQPVDGERHALSPDMRPRPGQERETVCGQQVTLIDPSDVDWLMPTCDDCMAEAIRWRDARVERERRNAAPPPESAAQAAARRLRGQQ